MIAAFPSRSFNRSRALAGIGKQRHPFQNRDVSFERQRTLCASTTSVTDCYILGRGKQGLMWEDVRSTQESLWSLQYTIPGVVTSFIGSVIQPRFRDERNLDFGIVYRFSNEINCSRFLEDEKFLETKKNRLESISDDVLTLTIRQTVDNVLETVFRKGELYEYGVDHLIVTRLNPGNKDDDAVQFLSVLGDVAKASDVGAVSTSVGTVLSSSDPTMVNGRVLACHLNTASGAKVFEEIPPVRQLWEENGNGLLTAQLTCTIRLDEN